MDSSLQNAEQRVLLLAATDEGPAAATLSRVGLGCLACQHAGEIEREMKRGVGVAVFAEEHLTAPVLRRLTELLSEQPPWSDIPLVVIVERSEGVATPLKTLGTLANVTVLERPLRVAALLDAVKSGLRGRRRQYQLRDLLARLEETDRRKDDFLAMLGRELRSPLAVIQDALGALAAADGAEGRQHAVIDREVRHLFRMVDDLLDVTQTAKDKVVLQRELVDLHQIVDRAVQSLASSDRGRRHALHVEREDADVTVSGDPARLQQIVGTVLSNAAQYTPDRGNIWISLHRQENAAIFRVRDDGIGIPQGMLTRVFEPFRKLERPLDRPQGGLGLSLPLARKLLAMHGGSIRAFSEGTGFGSEFVVRFPLAEAGAGARPAARDRGADRSLKILVIEDNDDGRESMRELLRLIGHEVDTARDGLSGIEKALVGQPELALVDIGLPGCDGYEVARRIRREEGGDAPWLVAMTGYGQPDDRRRVLEAGFDRHLVKPVSYQELSSLLREIATERSRPAAAS